MKKKILTITILALAVCLAFAFANPVMATGSNEKSDNTVASVTTSEGKTTYYDKLDLAFGEVKDGDVVKLENTIDIPSENGDGLVTFSQDVNATLDMNGFNITSSKEKTPTLKVTNGKLTITNSGSIKNTKGYPALVIQKGTVTLKSGVVCESDGSIDENSNYSAVQVGANDSADTDRAKLIIDGGTVKSSDQTGVGLFKTSSALEVRSGTITAKSYTVAGNGSGTKDYSVTISGGTLTSTDDAAIYQACTGNLKISGGTITGKIGLVARQGTVTVTGGTIVATGTLGQSMTVGDNKVELPLGSGIIVDNVVAGYTDSAKVTVIGSARFDTTGAPLVNYKNPENTGSAITVGTGPVFNQPVDEAYLAEGLIQAPNGKVMTEEDYEASLNSGDGTIDGDGEQPSESDGELDESPKAGVNDYTGILGAISSIALLGISVLRKRI